MLHVITGNGKGKTTAAVGLAVRARGAGLSVLFFQFLKGRPTGETRPLEQLGIKTLRGNTVKFLPELSVPERADYIASERERFLCTADLFPEFGMVVLDEAAAAVSCKIITAGELLHALPPSIECVLTGRDFPPEILEKADYISDIQCVRHPYERGVSARKGIEF